MKHALTTAAVFAGMLMTANAQAALITVNFDSLADNASANLDPIALANGITLLSGFTTDDLDAFGDPIPGQTHIEAYADSDIRVADPAPFGRDPAPSGSRAVNALFDQLLIRFTAPTTIDGFGFAEDPSSFGDVFGLPILLLDADGKTIADLGPYTPNGNASHRYDFSFGPVTVSQILLSSGSKLYDDISISTVAAVPEPASWALSIAGFGLLGASMRRRKKVVVHFA